MTWKFFMRQVDRLTSTFGKNAYGEERVLLIWREIKDLSDNWAEATVDKLIGEHRYAPLLPEFREEISKERERLWRVEKKQHAKEAKQFYSSYQADDIKTICAGIVKRVKGDMSDGDFDNLNQLLNYASKHNPNDTPVQCRTCKDTGKVFTPGNGVYRCFCHYGDSQPKVWPVFRREVGVS